MKLQSFTLQIFEPRKTLPFYMNVLGFKLKNEFSINGSTYYNLYFENTQFYLQLKYTLSLTKNTTQQKATDNYWKYSMFVDDIQNIYQKLQKQSYNINEPYQFGDIGYLAHTTDPENNQIEFIQKTFKDTPVKKATTTLNNLELGLITIRTKDPIKIISFFEELFNLKLFTRMYVDRGNGFTLYFLGDKNLNPPSKDIDAIENREWMYQQKHLFIEIQYYWNSEYDRDFHLTSTTNSGLQTINFTGNITLLKEKLITNNIPFQQENNTITVNTSDNHSIVINQLD